MSSVQAVYSPDRKKIAVVEQSPQDQFLSIIDNGTKTRLLRLSTSSTNIYFSFEPMRFSPDGRYIAFAELNYGTGPLISLDSFLYTIAVADGATHLVDSGHYPSWIRNP